jgi:predicted Zn-dependent protease
VATTLLHELGHAVGIGHSADDGSVMYPKLIDKASVTTADQAAFAYAGSRGC